MKASFGRNDLRAAYKIIKHLQRKKRTQHSLPDDESSGKKAIQRWHDFFTSLQTPAPVPETTYTNLPRLQIPTPPYITTDTSLPTSKEIIDSIANLKTWKASGPDGIPVEIIRSSKTCTDYIVKLLQEFWNTETLPESYCVGRTIMLHKKGPIADPANFRPITLLNHAYKALTGLLHSRMKPMVEATLLSTQSGFRPSRG